MRALDVVIGLVIGLVIGMAIYFAVPRTTVQTVTITSTQLTTTTQTATITQTVISPPQTVTVTQTVTAAQTGASVAQTVAMRIVASASAEINGTQGGAVALYPLVVVVPPGTYVKTPNGVLTTYNLTVVLLTAPTAATPNGEDTAFAFAYLVNGASSPQLTFVDSAGKPKPVITAALIPPTWTSWAYAGYNISGTEFVGGRYLFENAWVRAGPWLVNLGFVRPIAWVFAQRQKPWPEGQTTEVVNAPYSAGLVPVAVATTAINASNGGAVALGNILAVVQPGTYLFNGSAAQALYNFSLVYYSANVSGINGMKPLAAYAFAADGEVTAKYAFVNASGAPMPVITIALWPPGTTSWTWLAQGNAGAYEDLAMGSYKFPDVWIEAGPFMVNLQFFRPVPWVFLAGGAQAIITSGSSYASSGGGSSGYG